MTMDRSMIKRLVAQEATQPIIEEIERLRAELENEQQAKYRLIGQVADMTAEIEALRKELVEANSFIESLSKLCQAAEARAIELQSSPQCGRCGKHSVAEIHTCTPTG